MQSVWKVLATSLSSSFLPFCVMDQDIDLNQNAKASQKEGGISGCVSEPLTPEYSSVGSGQGWRDAGDAFRDGSIFSFTPEIPGCPGFRYRNTPCSKVFPSKK